MTEPQQNVTDIINKYSPITRGRTGLLGLAFKAVAKPLEIATDAFYAVEQWAFPSGWANSAGQLLTSTTATVASTFSRMESKLRASFSAAKNAGAEKRAQFLSLAGEVKKDAAVLAPHVNVLRSAFDIVNEPYKFIVAENTTLEQAEAAFAPAVVEQERKNPVTIRRNPQPYPQTGKVAAKGQ